MPNAYVGLATLKSAGAMNITGTADDTRLRQYIEAVSRAFDSYLGRHLYSLTATRRFSGNGRNRLLLPQDLIAVTSLKEDTTGDATYDTTWASTDYELAPYEAEPTGPAGRETTRPYWAIEINRRSNGTKTAFARGQKRFELVGKWGYAETKVDSGSLLNGALTAAATTATVDDGTDFEVAQTIMVDSEQMYVTAISTNTLTVERGVNGTTAAAHDDDATVNIIEYPPPVREAAIIQVMRQWSQRQAGYANQVGEDGLVRVASGRLAPEVMEKLDPYRRLWVA